jgi:hypothetical protein
VPGQSIPEAAHDPEFAILSPRIAYSQPNSDRFEDVAVAQLGVDWAVPDHADNARSVSRDLWMRQTILQSFCSAHEAQSLQSAHISDRQWKGLLRWMDIGGLALYFFDRVNELKLGHILPRGVQDRLQENLSDNTQRNRSLIQESVSIQMDFQQAHLSYAVLKGFSLSSVSVPKPELRHQFDLDFLIAEDSAPEARRILENRGFTLYGIGGRSLEFKRNVTPGIALKDLYKESPSFFAELHLEYSKPGNPQLLRRIVHEDLYGMQMPVLSPADHFLGQGLHAFKHICSEFSRASHLLEFYRHVLGRREDHAFWESLKPIADETPRATLGLGVTILLITRVMGEFAPEALTNWTVDTLPQWARLWVDRYAQRIAFASFPGTKLYLLPRKELISTGSPAKHSLTQALVPLRMPAPIIRRSPTDTPSIAIKRYRMQLQHLFTRARFHAVEGFRFAWESYRWRRYINKINQGSLI